MKRITFLIFPCIMIFAFSACVAVPDSPTEAVVLVPTATRVPATPTIVWFPPSETPTAQSLATTGPTPERKPGVGALLLSDVFGAAGPWNPAVSEEASIDVSHNRLTIAAQPGVNAFRVRQGPTLTNFYAEVTARPSLCRDGDEYGMLFRAPNNIAYYAFALACNGTAAVERVRAGRSYPALQPPTLSSDAPQGAPAEVQLGVWVSGPEMHFFLNDRYQFSVSDATYKSGAIGVFARAAGDTPVTVTFSDLSVYSVFYSASTPTP